MKVYLKYDLIRNYNSELAVGIFLISSCIRIFGSEFFKEIVIKIKNPFTIIEKFLGM